MNALALINKPDATGLLPDGELLAILCRLQKMDMTPLKGKMVEPYPGVVGVTPYQADMAVEAYFKFLALVVLYSKKGVSIVPTMYIDGTWHGHILDTYKYEQDCAAFLGFFLHHFPYFGLGGAEDRWNWRISYLWTRMLWEHHYGEAMPGSKAMVCNGGACRDLIK